MDFRVLGPFEVVVGGKGVPIGGPQQRALLALLVLRANEVLSTEALIRGLWGEAVPGSALAVVRTYVSRLRRALPATSGARLASRAPGYVLETDREQVDAHRFQQLVHRAQQAAGAGELDVASTTLRRALAMWRGTALADLAGLDSLRPVITRLEEGRLAAVESRFDAELGLGHHAEIVGELEALTDEHPFRERLWCQRIVALYRSGRQRDALAAYQAARSTLAEQVGVDPGPELRRLERLVLGQADELGWHAPPSPRAGAGRPPLQAGIDRALDDQRFVGRATERALLARRFEAARAGRFGAVLVAGPPGIGKTALVRRLVRDAHAAGATTLCGWADERTGVPFQPLEEAIAHWAHHAETAELDRLTEADAAHLTRIVPALAERRGDPPASPIPGEDATRQRLFAAVARWAAAVAAQRPAVVVLEDLHWADPATVLAVHHMLRHPPAAGVLLLLTYRDTEAVGDPLAEVLASTRGDDEVDRIDLAGLGDEDVVDLLRAETGQDPGRDGHGFATQLNRRTGGNPLFIHETLRHLVHCGAIEPAAGMWTGAQPLEAYGVPPGVAELIAQRLRNLPDDTTAVLQSAAVLGHHVDLALLSLTVDRPELAVIEALEPALAARLIIQDDPRADRFRFSHTLVREGILDHFPISQRIRTHWRAGQAIAARSTSNPGPHLSAVASHLAAGARAGDPGTALAANIRAGQHALTALAFEAASTQFATAVDLLDAMGDADAELAHAAWFGLGQASGGVGDIDRQRTCYLRAAAIARRHHQPTGLALAAIGLAVHWLAAGDAPDRAGGGDGLGGEVPLAEVVADLIDDALTSLGPTPTVERCVLLAIKTVHAVVLDQRDGIDDLTASAEAAARVLDDPTAAASALVARCWTLLGTPRPHELREAVERALSLPVGPEARVLLHNFVIPLRPVVALQLGDGREFASVRAQVARRETGNYLQLTDAWLHTWDAAMAICCGRFDDVVRLTEDLGSATNWLLWREVSSFQLGIAGIECGYETEVATAVTATLSMLPATPGAIALRALLAALLAAAGDSAGAAHHVDVVRRQRPLDQLGLNAPFVLRQLTEVAARLHDTHLAADLLPVLTGYSGQMLVSSGAVTVEGAADRAIGQLLLVLDRPDEAIERLAAARALEESLGADALTLRTTYWHARALLARGAADDQETARRLLDDAAAGAQRLGMTLLERDIAAVARL